MSRAFKVRARAGTWGLLRGLGHNTITEGDIAVPRRRKILAAIRLDLNDRVAERHVLRLRRASRHEPVAHDPKHGGQRTNSTCKRTHLHALALPPLPVAFELTAPAGERQVTTAPTQRPLQALRAPTPMQQAFQHF